MLFFWVADIQDCSTESFRPLGQWIWRVSFFSSSARWAYLFLVHGFPIRLGLWIWLAALVACSFLRAPFLFRRRGDECSDVRMHPPSSGFHLDGFRFGGPNQTNTLWPVELCSIGVLKHLQTQCRCMFAAKAAPCSQLPSFSVLGRFQIPNPNMTNHL